MNENKRVIKNASWLIVGGIVESILGFVISVLTVRYLGPNNYGLINYASSLMMFVSPIATLGFEYVIVYELLNNKEREGEILGTTIFLSLFASLFLYLSVLLFVVLVNGADKTTLIVCALYSVLLFFKSLNLISYWFQYKLLSKYVSIISIIAFILTSIYKIYILYESKDIFWFALTNSIDFGIIGILLFVIYKKEGGKKISINLELGKKIFAKSKYYILVGLASTIFVNTDQMMIKTLISNEANGYYSAAISCCNLTYFVFSAIINSYRPVIFENKNKSDEEYSKSIINLYSIVIFMALIQTVVMFLFSNQIINILYGDSYTETGYILKIISPIAVFNQISNASSIWILSEGKQKKISIINTIGATMNIVLNYILISNYGVYGAVISTVISYSFIGFFSYAIIPDLRYNIYMIIKSLNVKLIINNIRKITAKTKEVK